MDYSKLWKLLIDKGMSKTDLLSLTGISSRVLAKLSKNETVTTDTLARICAALECNVGDIMGCVSERELSLVAAYRKLGVCVEQNERVQTVRFAVGERKSTFTLSNLGVVKLPPELSEHITRMDFLLGVQSTAPYNSAIITYGDKMYLNIIRNIKESVLERELYETFKELGIKVVAESNTRTDRR
jgi:DNA-binding Xre family transcriptional regulator